MDDLDDELLDQSEMNDLFSRPIGQDSYMTDADLETGIKHIIFFLFKTFNSFKNWPVLPNQNFMEI